jgi:hypothetical protein
MDSHWIILLMFGPAVLALIALIAAIAIGSAASRAPANARLGYYVGIGLCGLVFFGIGTCYAMGFLSR